MKLIDILVEELPKCGGWDAKWHQCAQNGNGEVCFFTSGEIHFREIFDAWSIPSDSVSRHDGKARLEALLADDYSETIITREQYEAALAAKNDGWIEWGGGECPVPRGTLVDVKYRCGDVNYHTKAGEPDSAGSIDTAFAVRWSKLGAEYDITAYRLHKPQETTESDDEVDLNECIGQDVAPEWSGEGLPSVGCECEFVSGALPAASDDNKPHDGEIVKVVSHEKYEKTGNDVVVAVWVNEDNGMRASVFSPHCLRPIRSEEDKKRDDMANAIDGFISGFKNEKIGSNKKLAYALTDYLVLLDKL